MPRAMRAQIEAIMGRKRSNVLLAEQYICTVQIFIMRDVLDSSSVANNNFKEPRNQRASDSENKSSRYFFHRARSPF